MKAFAVLAVLMFVGSTASAGAHKSEAKDTLFKRLGGKKAITAVVDDFVGRAATDTRISSFFAPAAKNPKRLKAFKGNLVAQICEAAGGPCKYKGKDMKTAHQGMGIQNEHFDALVEDLTASLNKFKVAAADQQTLLGVLGPMRGDIVEGPGRETASDGTMPAPLAPETN